MREVGIYKDVPIDIYHKEEGISSSGVSLILDCPKRYWHEFLSETPKVAQESFSMGSALHTLVLEPFAFMERFYVMPEMDRRTKIGKELYENSLQKANGRVLLKKSEFDEVSEMAKSISSHSIWSKVKDGSVENSIYWDAGIYNTRFRARPDVFTDGLIIDLKTTDSIASFQRSVYSYGYHRQAAMQIDGLQTIDGKRRFFALFVVEKKAPYLTACFTLSEHYIEKGRDEYLDAAAIYSECMRTGEWPGYDEKVQLIELPNWIKKVGDENE